MRKSVHSLTVVVGLAMALCPSSALADGAKDIASATPITVDTQQFGNTTNGGRSRKDQYTDYVDSWWGLAVKSGDAVTIDWEAQVRSTRLQAYPIGTTDFTVSDTSPSINDALGDNGKSRATFDASSTGTVPISFHTVDSGNGKLLGPYSFTAYVKHALRLSIPRLPRLSPNGQVSVGVRDPDGGEINDPSVSVRIQAKRRAAKRYRTIGSAPVDNSVADVAYSLPGNLRHRKLVMRAVASGPSYIPQTSAVRKTRSS